MEMSTAEDSGVGIWVAFGVFSESGVHFHNVLGVDVEA